MPPNFQPRYDERRGIYRDCKWCHGTGCLSCEAERDKEYARQFPNGPTPIATFKTDGTEAAMIGLLGKLLGPAALASAKQEATTKATEIMTRSPVVAAMVKMGNPDITEAQILTALTASFVPEIVAANIIKAGRSPSAEK